MGLLENTMCYLIGPMQYSTDHGIGWRKKIIAMSNARNLGVTYLDPTDKPAGLPEEVGEAQTKLLDFKDNREWDKLSKAVKNIVHADLRMVDRCEFTIAFLDPDIYTCGSWWEIHESLRQKKPTLLIVKGGKSCTPLWLFGVLDHRYIYDSLDQCMAYLEKVNRESEPPNDKWILFNKYIAQK